MSLWKIDYSSLQRGENALQSSCKLIGPFFQNRPVQISSLTGGTSNSFRLPIGGNGTNGKGQHCPVVIKVTKRCGIHADTDAVFFFLHLVQTDPVLFQTAISRFTLKCSNSKSLQVVIPTEPMKGCVTLLASLRPASFASWVFWPLQDESHLCSFCFLPSVTVRQRTAGPPWGLPAIRLCHLCPGASLVDTWPQPWRKWSTSGRSTVNNAFLSSLSLPSIGLWTTACVSH